MKKRIFLMMLLAVALFSCQKEKSDAVTEQEVTFTAIQIDPGAGLKNTNDWDWKCNPLLEPVYAEIDLYVGAAFYGTFRPLVFALDGKLYTQAIKLPPGTYTVDKFLVMDDMGTPGDLTDDLIYMATPTAGADYSQYTDPDVRFDFDVDAFKKAEVEVEVLCFIPSVYTGFGFTWFHITEIIVREVCFFGDICLNGEPWFIADFTGSLYEANGLQEDEIAYFNVVVKKDGIEVPGSPFSMEPIYGTGFPLCVQYPDNLGITGEVFTFELWVLVRDQVGAFVFQLYDTYTAIDNGPLTKGIPAVPAVGAEGIVDFAVGTCSPMSTNIYTWLDPPSPPCSPYQGFEYHIDGWGTNGIGYGVVTRVASGTNGITSSAGSFHAIFTESISPASGPFTRYCGYVTTWPGNWTAEADIYLDPSWAAGEGFDYAVATNNSGGTHLRDFIFHVGVVTGNGLLVNASNNSDFYANSWKLLNENGGNYYTVTAAGWYTFKHVLRDNAGVLAVDFVLLDSGGNTLWTVTRSNETDLIPSVVGGHRYGWFTFIDIASGMAIDETNLY